MLSGDYSYAAGGTADSIITIGSFVHAVALSSDPDGNLYVVDAGKNALVKLSRRDKSERSLGGFGWGTMTFDQPSDVAISTGLDVYVADYGNHRIQRFDHNLNYVGTLSGRSDPRQEVSFGYPTSVAVTRSGTLFIVDEENTRIAVVNPQEGRSWYFGGNDAKNIALSKPKRVRITDDDVVYVQDGNLLRGYDVFGNYIRTIGNGVFHRLTTFVVSDSVLYAADGCTLYTLTSAGVVQDSMDIHSLAREPERCVLLDIAITKEDYIFLFEHCVVYVPVGIMQRMHIN